MRPLLKAIKKVLPFIVLMWVVICLGVGFLVHQWFYTLEILGWAIVWLFCVCGYFLLELQRDEPEPIDWLGTQTQKRRGIK